MKELRDDKLLAKSKNLFSNILKLKKLNIGNNYCANMLDWFNVVVLKNIGRNIGSEFQDYHYAVVLFESKYTAIVVPLTSKKEHDPAWIEENKDFIVDLGVVAGYPNESKDCYACTFMLQTVSKKRLDRCGNKETGYFNIRISDEQMAAICNKINNITYNTLNDIDN